MSQLDEMLNAKMYAEKAYYANLGGAKSAQPISNMRPMRGLRSVPSRRSRAARQPSPRRG